MSNDIAIKVEGLYKQYRLGVIGAGTLKDDLKSLWYKLQGKSFRDYINIDENDRMTGTSDYVWALRDINFEVKQGEILGIIGKNGAGKSTLLKILSKVTGPTKGQIKVNGRIASLLEVGTGFHPELTGRENIFLNGAILGMTKKEIKSKLEEIVEFSGIGKYIDTPVKRYSSGMKVRMGFAVAAHLEPEILIVDEVLAVGDAEFQKRCIGKMNDVSKNQGRTVLFVSHNMASVMELCDRGLLIKNGMVHSTGLISDIIPQYLNTFKAEEQTKDLSIITNREGNGHIRFEKVEFLNERDQEIEYALSGQNLKIQFTLRVNTPGDYNRLHFSVKFVDNNDFDLFHLSNTVANGKEFRLEENHTTFKIVCEIKKLPLNIGIFKFHLFCSDKIKVFDKIDFAGELKVEGGNFYSSGKLPPKGKGALLVENKWQLIS
jgi:lipopolysaccharide transport system ATP-binding protein